MGKKILLFVLVISILVAFVGVMFYQDPYRSLTYHRFSDAVESVSGSGNQFIDDFLLISCVLDIADHVFENLDYNYTLLIPKKSQIRDSGSKYCFLVLVSYEGIPTAENLRESHTIETSFTIADYYRFERFAERVQNRTAALLSRLTLFNGLSFFLIDIIEVAYLVITLIISFVPILALLLFDSFTVIKSLILFPFKLLF